MIERPSLQALALFLAVVKHDTMTAAAEAEGVAQPAISVHVRNLERYYGVPLMERSGRRVRPTAAGMLVATHARQIIALVDELRYAVDDLDELRTGRLVIGASATVAETWLAAMLGRFRQMHPAIDLEVHSGNSEHIVEEVRRRELGFGIIGRPSPDPALITHPIFTDTLRVFAATGSPLSKRSSVRLGELSDEIFILREPGSATRDVVLDCLAGLKIKPKRSVQLGSNEAVKRAVSAGLGIGILSSLTLDVEIRAGDVVVLPCSDWECHRQFWLVQRSDRDPPKAERAFLELLSTWPEVPGKNP